MENFVVFFIFLHSLPLRSPLKLPGKFQRARDKFKGILKGKEGSRGIQELEFPGTNETLRQFHEERWKDYYECLEAKYAASGKHKTLYPSTLMTIEGSSVLLDCEICISPSELHTIETIEWFYNSTSNTTLANVAVDVDEHTIISPNDRSLHMYNIGIEKEGFYWCQLQTTISNPHYVHIINATEPLRVVQGEEAPEALHPEPPEIIEDYGLRIFSLWSTWSSCSRCDIVGRKQRYGYCTVALINSGGNDFIRRRRNEDEEDTTSGMDLSSVIEKLLIFFGNKLPCRSRYTPKKIQELPQVKNRKNELMKRFCKIKCQENVIFEVRDEMGNVIESANNSAGIYSVIQGVPEPQPSVQRVTLYKKHNTRGELKCPGNLNTETPIKWQIGTKALNPLTIKEESKERISVDSKDRLIFKKLRFKDSNIYSCWQRGKLAGTIRLEVAYEVEVKADHRVLMVGAIAIVLVFITVFWRAFKGRKRYTMH